LAGLSLFVLLRWCAVQTMAFIVHCKLKTNRPDSPTTWPLVSILVPAYQEATTIASALRALVDLDYPNYEIIVVDDGSSDDTFDQASAFVGRHDRCSLQLLRKANGGKWSALNLAFERAAADLVLCIDADSRISPDALKRLIMRMDRPEVAGVSGQITVRNRRRIITRLQAYEYVVANGGLRTAQSLFGMVLVVPGPIGLYRRKALQDVFEKDIRIANRPPSGAGDDRVVFPASALAPHSSARSCSAITKGRLSILRKFCIRWASSRPSSRWPSTTISSWPLFRNGPPRTCA